MNIKQFLINIYIIQQVDNNERLKNKLGRLGRGRFFAERINPFNPLSYILVVVTIPVILLMYGFIGTFERASNPFKWN